MGSASAGVARRTDPGAPTTSRRAQTAAGLLVVGLQQRLLSSTEAFARSLRVHRATVARQWETAHRAAQETAEEANPSIDGEADLFSTAPGADDERGTWTDEQLDTEETAQIEAVTASAEAEAPRGAVAEALWRREQALLDRMQEIAEATRHLPDPKLLRLLDWLRENLCPGLPPFGQAPQGPAPTWNPRRVLLFAENREGTERYLRTLLEQAIEGTDRAAELDGQTLLREAP